MRCESLRDSAIPSASPTEHRCDYAPAPDIATTGPVEVFDAISGHQIAKIDDRAVQQRVESGVDYLYNTNFLAARSDARQSIATTACILT